MPKSRILNEYDALDALPPEMRNTTVTLPGPLADRYGVLADKLKISRSELLTRVLLAEADALEKICGLEDKG